MWNAGVYGAGVCGVRCWGVGLLSIECEMLGAGVLEWWSVW